MPQTTTGADQLRTAARRLNQAHGDTVTSMEVSARVERLDPDHRDLHFILGWLTAGAPAAVDDALDAMVTYRDTVKKG